MKNSSLNAKGIVCTEMFCLYCNLVNSQKSKSMNLTEPESRAVERDGLALAGGILDGELERLVELGADGALHVRERLARDILPVDLLE